MEKQKIYILQMHTKTLPARLVKLFTGYKYSHVAISLDRDCEIIYSFGRRSLRNIFNGGFVKQSKNDEFFEKFNKTVCRIYELNIECESYDKLKNILSFMEANQEKYKYDFLGAVLRYLNIHIHFKNKYVCSTFVAEALQQSGAYKFNKKIHLVKPIDFESLDGAKLIYTGEYKNITSDNGGLL